MKRFLMLPLARWLARWLMTWALLTSGIVFLIAWTGGVFVNAVPLVGIALWAVVFAALLVSVETRLTSNRAKVRA